MYHGFVRAANGTITTFDAPGAGTGPGSPKGFPGVGTIPVSINTAGDIAGTYTDASGVAHGFVRAANGTITTFDAPGAGPGTGTIRGTVGGSINDTGNIAGMYSDASDVFHGLVRAANGTITTFDAPGVGAGMGLLQGTGGFSINSVGAVTGAYTDASAVVHGFVLTPAGGSLSPTKTNLTSGTNPAIVNSFVTFTATVTPTGTTPPTGTVTFQDGATAIGMATLNTSSVATFTTSSLTLGLHSISAVYGGDASNAGSTSAVVTETIVSSGGAAVPVLTSLSPSSATAGGSPFVLTLNGSNFVSGSAVFWNGSSRTTTFISSTQLQATITDLDIVTAGLALVAVNNPAAAGDNSNPQTFAILELFSGSGGYLSMFVNGTSLGNSMLFQSGGFVGVGTTSPDRTLDVNGEIQARGGNLFLQRNLTDQAGRRNWAWGTETFNVGDMAFFVSTGNSNAPSVNVMTLLSNGNVGIGLTATTPATTLQVGGDIRVGTSGTNGCVQNFAGTTLTGICSSDARLKTNILPFAPILDKLVKLRPVHFEWNAEQYPDYHFGPGRNSGLLAQDVETVFPEMVSADTHGFKTVNYSELPYLMLTAIRELKTENDSLRTQLAERQRELEELRQEVEARLARLERTPSHRTKKKTAVRPKPAAAAKAQP